MAVKILCALITVTLLFGEIRANVEPRSSSPEKYVPMSSVFPSSLLFLLNRSRLKNSSLPSKPAVPSNPALPSVSSSPASPFNPDVPNSPDVPLSPTTPYLPNSPSLPPSPIKQPPSHPLPYYPHRATVQYFSSPVNSAPTPGQLSYGYGSGNIKLINKVHIPLKRNPTQPQPVGALPLNHDSSDNVPSSQQQPLPSNPNIVPLGAVPLNDQSNTGNTNTIKPEDLTPEPIDTIGASPIPVKPNDISDSDDSKNTITLNPKDIPYQPVSNIEASPIPIRPEVNGSENSEDLSPLPSDAVVGPSIPNQAEHNNNEDATGDENTQTINPGDLTRGPTDTIASSPIPVRSKNHQAPSLEASDIAESQALPIKPEVNNSENNEDLSPLQSKAAVGPSIPNKPNGSSDSDDSKNTVTFNPKDIPYQPVSNIEASPIPIRPEVNGSENNEDLSPLASDAVVGPSIPNQADNNGDASGEENIQTINTGDLTPEPTDTIAASPIPVKSKNNQPPSLETSDITKPQAGNDESQEITQERNDDSSNDQNEAPENNEEPENPLKDSVLNGTSSSDKYANFNPLGNLILNGTSSQGSRKSGSSDEAENPVKDRILNEPSSQDEETESESSGVENSVPNHESTETESREVSQKYLDNGDGIQSSNTEQQESEVQNVECEDERN